MNLFKNKFKYNKKTLKKLRCFQTNRTNLSSMIYARYPHEEVFQGNSPVIFEFERLIPFREAVIIKKLHGELHIIVQPELEELAKTFGFQGLKTKNNILENDVNYLLSLYRRKYDYLVEAVKKFCKTRHLYLNGHGLFETEVLTYSENIEMSKIVQHLQGINYSFKMRYFDYKDKLTRESYEEEVLPIYNYKTLSNVVQKYIDDKIEYLVTCNKITKLLTQKELQEKVSKLSTMMVIELSHTKTLLNITKDHMEKLNDSPYFATEYLIKLNAALKKYVEKEEVLDIFINRMLNNDLTYIRVKGRHWFYTRRKLY